MPLALGQSDRPPRVRRVTFTLIPAASTSAVPVQVPGFEDSGLLTHCVRLLCDSCSSGQCFAFGFLQIPPRGRHPCRSANRSPCRVGRGLPPPSHPAITTMTGIAPIKALRAMPGVPQKKPAPEGAGLVTHKCQGAVTCPDACYLLLTTGPLLLRQAQPAGSSGR
jgi:hypothetical protein